VHFVWLVKSDIREPLLWGAVLAALLLLRVPPIRRWASRLRYSVPKRFQSVRKKSGELAAE
ncbi:MAG: hypothetical protein R3335_14440, partial [Anaerolineales bacterium]|nr:hypothetical protein [Anaerolineales bacterium]